MEAKRPWRERLDHWTRRGGFFTSRQDVDDLVAPLVERIAALEREVQRLRDDGKK